MSNLQKRPLLRAIVICAILALWGSLLVGDALETWYPTLIKPTWLVPLSVFYVVGVLYYLLFTFVLYRILTRIKVQQASRTAFSAALLVLIANELWNWAFFGLRSPWAGFFGIGLFLVLLTILIRILWRLERVSAVALLPYFAWIVYDLLWTFQLWQLNL